jgi:calmodulin
MLGKLFEIVGQTPTDQELKEMLDEVDLSKNGKLSFGEFVSLLNRKSKEFDNEEEIIEAFRMFATDKDGLIKFDNLRDMCDRMDMLLTDEDMKHVTDEEITEMIRQADPEGK